MLPLDTQLILLYDYPLIKSGHAVYRLFEVILLGLVLDAKPRTVLGIVGGRGTKSKTHIPSHFIVGE
jgi:hypothetical protein